MKKLFNKMFCFLLAFCIASVVLTSCGGGGLPNGRYAPSNDIANSLMQAIIINGNNFTVVYPFTGQSITVKYEYTNGTLKLSDGTMTGGLPVEFKKGINGRDTIFFAQIPFVKDVK